MGDVVLLEGGADFAFRMETQRMANFLETLESSGHTDGTLISQFEAAMGSEFVFVAFVTSVELGLTAIENTSIGHVS